jgi:hypothetical protein
MRCPATALAAALVLGAAVAAVAARAQAPEDDPAARVTLPSALAERLGEDLPEVVWVGLHPRRNDGARVLLRDGWTLITGFSADARAEVKAARKLPRRTPPVPSPERVSLTPQSRRPLFGSSR